MAKGERTIEGNDGKYLVRCDGKGCDIVSCNDSSSVRLDFDAEELTWSVEADGKSHVLSSSSLTTPHVKVPVDGGRRYRTVEVSRAGVYAYQEIATASAFAAR